MKKLSSFMWTAGTLLMLAAIAAPPMSFAQTQGTQQPKHSAWSDTSLSPDARADMVIKELTLEEKISFLHGQGSPFGSTAPTESNGGEGYSVGIPRLGISAIQMADSAAEPPKRLIGWARVELSAGESKVVTVPVDRDRLTVNDEAADAWKFVPGSHTMMAGGSSQDLPLHKQIALQ